MKQNQTVTVTLRREDAEPILRKAAYEAAKFGAFVDHCTRRTVNCPHRGHGESFEDAKARWSKWYLQAKRTVEAFGVEYSMTSAEETIGIYWPPKPGTGTQYVPDYANPLPMHRGEIHSQACHAAAERVVRAWKAKLADEDEQRHAEDYWRAKNYETKAPRLVEDCRP